MRKGISWLFAMRRSRSLTASLMDMPLARSAMFVVNTHLVLRVAYFNKLATYCKVKACFNFTCN